MMKAGVEGRREGAMRLVVVFQGQQKQMEWHLRCRTGLVKLPDVDDLHSIRMNISRQMSCRGFRMKAMGFLKPMATHQISMYRHKSINLLSRAKSIRMKISRQMNCLGSRTKAKSLLKPKAAHQMATYQHNSINSLPRARTHFQHHHTLKTTPRTNLPNQTHQEPTTHPHHPHHHTPSPSSPKNGPSPATQQKHPTTPPTSP